MRAVTLAAEDDFEGWRDAARALAQAHVAPPEIVWRVGEGGGDLFEQLRLELQSHAAAEEESLYATMLANPELREDARHSVSEHKEVDDLLGELMDIEMSSSAWLSKFRAMKDRYLHHIDEEEEEMFPAAAEELDNATEEELATIYEERKPEELELAKANPPGGDERE